MTNQGQTVEPPAAAPSLKRVIGVSGLAFASFNSIVGSGIFALPGKVAKVLGPAAILAYLICLAVIALVGLCFAELGSRVTSAGGIYAYARVPFGPVIGGIAGTLLWSANCVVPSAAIAVLMTDTLALSWPALSGAMPRTLFLLVIYLFLAVVNIRGTRSGERFSLVMALIKLTPLVLLAVCGLFAAQAENFHWAGMPTAASMGRGSVILFFAFMGIEGGLTASGEVANPSRTIPRAIALALTIIAVLYIGLQIAAQGVLGDNLAATKAPLVAAATVVWGPWGGRFLVATTILSAAGYLMGDMLCSPRSLFALAENKQLPRPLAAIHPRFATPAAAIGTYSALCFATAAFGTFRYLTIIATSGTLLLYLICCLGLVRLRAQNIFMGGEPFRAPGGMFVPLAASVLIAWMLTTLKREDLGATAGLVIVSGCLYAGREMMRGKAARNLAQAPD